MPSTLAATAAPSTDHDVTNEASPREWVIDPRNTLRQRGLGLTPAQWQKLALAPLGTDLTVHGADVRFLGILIGRVTRWTVEADTEALAAVVGMTGNYGTACRHAPGPDPITCDCGDQLCSDGACHTRHLADCPEGAAEAARWADTY